MKYIITILLFFSVSLFAQEKSPWRLVREGGINEIILDMNCNDTTDCLASINQANNFQLLSSTDGGNNWKIVYSELWDQHSPPPNPFYPAEMQYPAPGYIYLSYYDGGYIKRLYDKEGSKIDTIKLPTEYRLTHFHMIDSITGIVSTPQTMFITKNGWKNWEQVKIEIDQEKFITDIYMRDTLNFDFLDSHGILGPNYYRTTDGGKTWSSNKLSELDVSIKKIFFLDDNTGWIAGKLPNGLGDQSADIIFKTTDGGTNWKLIYNQENSPIFGLQEIAFCDEMNGVAVGQFGKIIRTNDGGANWVLEVQPETFGINGPPTMTVTYLDKTPIIGTFSRGIYKRDIETGIIDRKTYDFENNSYPYPQPATNIVRSLIYFDNEVLSEDVEIFDRFGTKVGGAEDISIDKVKSYSAILSWNCSGVATGVYFIRVRNGNRVWVLKVIVRK